MSPSAEPARMRTISISRKSPAARSRSTARTPTPAPPTSMLGILNLGGTLASPITVNAGATLGGEGSTTSSLTFATGNSALQFDPAALRPRRSRRTRWMSPPRALSCLSARRPPPRPATAYTVLKRVTGSFVPGDLAKFALATRGGSLSITGAGNNEITLTAAASTSGSADLEGQRWHQSHLLGRRHHPQLGQQRSRPFLHRRCGHLQ